MEREPPQQPGSGLRETLALWFRNPVSWLALLYAGLAVAAVLMGSDSASWPGRLPAFALLAIAALSGALFYLRQALATGVVATAQANHAKRAAEARLSVLIRNSADVIAIVAADGAMSYLTPSAERVFGLPAEALIGRPIADLVAAEDRARLREFITRDLAQAGVSATIEARIPRGGDQQRIVEIHGTNLQEEPTVGGHLLNLRDTTDRKGIEEQLRRLAFHDQLTLLANRALFHDRVEHALAVNKRSYGGVAVMFIDLDNFKKINDNLGHDQGDKVLRTSAQRLSQCTRTGDTVARLGGDEFAVLLENLDGQQVVIEIAARMVEALQEPFAFLDGDLRVTASVGIAFATADDGVEQLQRNADLAMYSAKAQGKGRYVIFEATMQHAAYQRLEVEAELSRALNEGQFQVHYEPIIELRSGYLLGVEALVRWQHPTRGLIAPSEFIGIAENSGQLVALGRWVLCQACREVRAWQTRLPEGRQVRVAVNVSIGQLLRSDLVADVTEALNQSELDPGCLVIEMAERVLTHDAESTLAKLIHLKTLGVRIAIEDFGTGYSSLSYLHRFPIDILKIDRSFVERLGGVEDGAALARAVITLGDTLGLEVVAEGIEAKHQQRELIALGCVAGQGCYYSKPAMLHELECSVPMIRRRTMSDTLPQGARFTATGRFLVGNMRRPDLEPTATGTFGPELIIKRK
jgi:diguanylate cyclase (GGDEF)-like protein/PAS domain S-box-containing protein